MKKIAYLTIFALLFSNISTAIAEDPVLTEDPPAEEDPIIPEITSFSPTEITPGETILTISGVSLGSPFNSPENQICFGDDDCRDATDLNDYLQSWSDTEIQVLVPEDITNESGEIKLRVYFTDTAEFDFIESIEEYTIAVEEDPPAEEEEDPPAEEEEDPPAEEEDPPAAEDPIIPEITSFSPAELTPEETIITINGLHFSDEYTIGSNQICFGEDGCISDDYIDEYLVSWSDTEIQVLTPYFVTQLGPIELVLLLPDTEIYGLAESATQYTVIILPDPEITSISPTTLIAGDTVVTIEGQAFGENYTPGYNQICFGEDGCIADNNIGNYLISWSDTEIQFTTPNFVTSESGTISIKAYFPSKGYYDFAESPAYTTVKKPTVEWYYLQMDQGKTYPYTGQNFGATTGKVVLSGQECEIVSWSDTEIYFTVPENATSGKLYIENAAGIKSSELSIIIIPVQIYSNDEYSNLQWQMNILHMTDAWNVTEGSSDVVVAVIDSGVDIYHEDLKHAIWLNEDEIANNGIDDDNNGYIDDIHGWDFVLDTNSMDNRGPHGTMVSGLIAAKKDNGIGIAGIAPNVKIMPLNIANSDGLTVSVDGGLLAVKYAVDNGADIINLSFGGYESNQYYEDVVQYAYDNNVLVIAATGNDGIDLAYYPFAPACVDLSNNSVIGVAATGPANILSYFSNYGGGTCTDVSAPGENLALAVPSNYGYYSSNSGTSFASPLVAGVAALIKSEHPDWNVEEIKHVILNNTTNIDGINSLYANKLGSGIPNAYAALTSIKPNVSYNYNPHTDIDIEETGAEIDIDVPEPDPIVDEPEPIKKDESIDEDKTEKNTDPIEIEDSPKDDSNSASTPESSPKQFTYQPGTIINSSFHDTQSHKYEPAIAFVEANGIVSGYSDYSFKPDNVINRAEFTKILVNAFVTSNILGTNCFNDVNVEWFAPYVCTAKKLSIINGYPSGDFEPDQFISVAEALKIILNTIEIDLPNISPNDAWYAPYIWYATYSNLSFILSNNDISDHITRGEMAELIYQVVQ